MRKTRRKLQLASETLRNLSAAALRAAQGGQAGYTEWGCSNVNCPTVRWTYCNSCPPECDSCNACIEAPAD